MVLLCIILSDLDKLEEILEAFLEIGITGASIIQARGMGEFLSQEVPIFAGLRSLFPGREGQHQLLISVTRREQVAEALELVEKIHGPLTERGGGVAFTLPVEKTWGLAKEL